MDGTPEILITIVPILIPLVVVTILAAVFLPMLLKSIGISKIRKTGERAVGRIIAIRDTPVTINERPQIELELEVNRDDGSALTAKTLALWSPATAQQFAVGSLLPVRLDPNDSKKIALELTPEGLQFVQQRIEFVQNKLLSEESLKQSGEKAQAVIVALREKGVTGQMRHFDLDLEVRPEFGVAYRFTKGVAVSPKRMPLVKIGSVLPVRVSADRIQLALDFPLPPPEELSSLYRSQ